AGDIPAWPRETRDETRADGVSDQNDNRNSDGRCFGGKGGGRAPSHDDVDIAANETGSDVGNLLQRTLRPTTGDGKTLPLDVTTLAQSITECAEHCGRRNCGGKKTNADLFVVLALLRARRDRPRGCRAADKRDEFASPDVRHGAPPPVQESTAQSAYHTLNLP